MYFQEWNIDLAISHKLEVATPVSDLYCQLATAATRIDGNTSGDGTGLGRGVRFAVSFQVNQTIRSHENQHVQGPNGTQYDIF